MLSRYGPRVTHSNQLALLARRRAGWYSADTLWRACAVPPPDLTPPYLQNPPAKEAPCASTFLSCSLERSCS